MIKIRTYEELAKVYDIFLELRPHLHDRDSFIKQVIEQQKEGYQVIGLELDNKIVTCAGFRFITTLAWGKVLYIDDFITRENMRGLGYGKMLLDNHL